MSAIGATSATGMVDRGRPGQNSAAAFKQFFQSIRAISAGLI
jgi:hypothetical protein